MVSGYSAEPGSQEISKVFGIGVLAIGSCQQCNRGSLRTFADAEAIAEYVVPLVVAHRRLAFLKGQHEIRTEMLERVSELPDIVDRQEVCQPACQGISTHAEEASHTAQQLFLLP